MANANYCPPGTALPPGRIQSYLAEILKLSQDDVRGVGISLQATLSSTTPGTDTYRVPSDQELVITTIQGYLAFSTLNSESTAILGWLNLDPSERWFVKSQNCVVGLANQDRNLQIFDNRDQRMSAITPPVGVPMQFSLEMPFIVPAGHTLKGTFTLQDSTSAIVSGATVYGLLLTGALIPKADR